MTQSSELFSALSPSANIPLPREEQTSAAAMPTGKCLGPLLALLVAALGFLLASFPARNSDIWLHLARGRLLAQGEFSATTGSDLAFDLWGNQTWLYDLFCYGCYRVLGGAGLVFGKALLAAGIALLLLWMGRSARTGSVSNGSTAVVDAPRAFPGWCLPAVCASLALLTMSLYLLLQPALLSLFLLAVAFFLLHQPANAGRCPFWSLVLLFVLWANVDRWFVLGLVVVALTWLGEGVDEVFAGGVSSKQWQVTLLRRGFLFVILAAVCLLNPSHLYAFVLLDELTRFGSSAGQTMSPFTSAYFAKVGYGPASLAYFVLLGLSLISFLAALPRWSWRRFLPWLGLALVSALQARAVPFFAAVAGPVLAWNISQRAATRGLTLPVRTAATLTALMILALVVCAWPGWLQNPPYGPRRWSFDLPPSLERGAAAVQRWHEQGKLATDSGGLHLSAETIYAFAWFCPTEKRLRWVPEGSAAEWRQQMRAEGIDHVFVYSADRDRLAAFLGDLVVDTEQWPLLYQEGDLAIFGWRDPGSSLQEDKERGDRFRGWQLDLNQLAFHPPEDKKAPAEAVDPQAAGRSWWEAFWKDAPLRSLDRDEALMHLLHAEALQRWAPLQHLNCWENSQAAGLLGAAAAWVSPVALCDASLRLALFRPQLPEEGSQTARLSPLDRMVMGLQRRYTLQRDDAPPALYYLAVRAARRAVAANPEDASAYLLLGESYLGLLHATRERAWGGQLPWLLQLRQAQASAALNRAVALRPDFLPAHLHLGRLYQEMGYLDLALQHWQTVRQLARQGGLLTGINRAEFQERVERLAREVQKRQDSFTLSSADRPPRERAFRAFQSGLAGKALDLLLESDRAAFGNEGVKLELELLLNVGRAQDVREWLSPEDEKDLGSFSYHWFRVRATAASGDYTRAEEECEEAARALALSPNSPQLMHLRANMALLIATLVLDGQRPPEATFAHLLARINQGALAVQLQTLAQRLQQQADLNVFRGLLALEEGEVEEAEFAFRTALALWKDEDTAAAGGGLDFNGRTIAQDCLRWLRSN